MLKIISTYTLTQYINKGEYGKVYKAINHDTSQNVAIKMISLEKFIQNSKLIQLTKQQVEILSTVEKNQNIIKLKQIIKSNRYLYMVYEYCQGGTLEEYLNKNRKLTEKQAIIIFRQLINAYRSLYENNIVHRDIKTDNIFFKNGQLKLADFGFSKKLKYQDDLMQTSLGSPLYMAPQVLNNDVYGSKADLWSCGIILYQMLFNTTPYSTYNIKQLLQYYSQKSQLPLPYYESLNLSPTIIKMLKRILTKDQFRRISWQQFLYEYQFTSQGEIIHRQRDFQYDLMKLMKKNSSMQSDSKGKSQGQRENKSNKGNSKVIKFDWSKITDMNSSVHSQECQQQNQQQQFRRQQLLRFSSPRHQTFNTRQQQQQPLLFHSGKLIHTNSLTSFSNPNQYLSQHNIPLQQQNQQQLQQRITSIYNLKKMIKHYQQEHTKILDVVLILEQMLESNKDYDCDLRVGYVLVYNIGQLLRRNVNGIGLYMQNNKQLLTTLPQQKQKLQRMKRIFSTELQTNSLKINSIKTLLLTVDNLSIGLQIFKYPNKKQVLRTVMKQYVKNYELENEGVLELVRQKGQNGQNKDKDEKSISRQQQLRLLRILWAVQLLQQRDVEYCHNINNNRNNNINKNKSKNNSNRQPFKNKPQKFNTYSLLSIKQQTTTHQLSILINRYLVQIGI